MNDFVLKWSFIHSLKLNKIGDRVKSFEKAEVSSILKDVILLLLLLL